jgi:hypothetical protein
MNTTTRPELEDALNNHTLALFLGADLLREVTGLPSRADLARDMARRYHLDESLSLAEVAQRVSQAGNRFEFTDFIRIALDTSGKLPATFHQGIVKLVKDYDIRTIITTANDRLLEKAFEQAGVGFNRVVCDEEITLTRTHPLTLIKLYGDVQNVGTLTVTERDHSQLLHDPKKKPIVDEVRQTFTRNTILFYGYNLSDPDFMFLFDQIAENRFARLAYAVWPGMSETDKQMWRDRGIVILEKDPLGAFIREGVGPFGRLAAKLAGKQHFSRQGVRIPRWIVLLLVPLLFLIVAGFVSEWAETRNCQNKCLYTYQKGIEGWQNEPSGDGRQVATTVILQPVQLFQNSAEMRLEFDFGRASPAVSQSGTDEPRATFFVDNLEYKDWTQYPVLAFDAMNPTARSLKMNISLFVGDCWYELGEWHNLTQEWQTYEFDLEQTKYKTCKNPGEYDQSFPPLGNVRRLDLIIGTNEFHTAWPTIHGSVLIDNVRLIANSHP